MRLFRTMTQQVNIFCLFKESALIDEYSCVSKLPPNFRCNTVLRNSGNPFFQKRIHRPGTTNGHCDCFNLTMQPMFQRQTDVNFGGIQNYRCNQNVDKLNTILHHHLHPTLFSFKVNNFLLMQ